MCWDKCTARWSMVTAISWVKFVCEPRFSGKRRHIPSGCDCWKDIMNTRPWFGSHVQSRTAADRRSSRRLWQLVAAHWRVLCRSRNYLHRSVKLHGSSRRHLPRTLKKSIVKMISLNLAACTCVIFYLRVAKSQSMRRSKWTPLCLSKSQ